MTVNLPQHLNCFKAYDIRGKVGDEFNEEIAYRIGRATAQLLKAKKVVVGFDARETSPTLAKAVISGICDAGSASVEIGQAGTEEMYFAVLESQAEAGIEITASHNPIEYNGMKIVKYGSQALSEEEFVNIKLLAEQNCFEKHQCAGLVLDKKIELRAAYLKKILSFIDLKVLKPLKIVINSGNGVAGPVVDAVIKLIKSQGIKSEIIRINHNPDPFFPNGIPNPLIKRNQAITGEIVKKESADFGVAFDGDFDRCFIFDNNGEFISGEYVVGLLTQIFLKKENSAKIVHDRRVISNISSIINETGGSAVISKAGHAYMKKTMSEASAIYGGEMSGHHYFRDLASCDSGMIPWLMIWEFLSIKRISLADLMKERRLLFPSSGEINFKVLDAQNSIDKVKEIFSSSAKNLDEIDGLSISFERWRFNLRISNTEPLVRLNIETNGDERLLKEKVKELTELIAED